MKTIRVLAWVQLILMGISVLSIELPEGESSAYVIGFLSGYAILIALPVLVLKHMSENK